MFVSSRLRILVTVAEFATLMNDVPLEQLGPCRLIRPIGQGECGAVYRARNTMLNRDVAIPKAIAIAAKCACSLHHAHEQGVVHRDIKPRNILFDRGNEPRIADFALAVAMRTDATMTYLLGAGTPLYMAPEPIMEETSSPQTDLFSLTVVLYELLTGRHCTWGRRTLRKLSYAKGNQKLS
jgi:serine/threonine protein kinase